MVAEGAFVLGSELAHSGLGAQVLVVGLEADAAEVEGFEGVGELEELGLGVDGGALEGGADGGRHGVVGELFDVVKRLAERDAEAAPLLRGRILEEPRLGLCGAELRLPWRPDFNALGYVLAGSGTAGPPAIPRLVETLPRTA